MASAAVAARLQPPGGSRMSLLAAAGLGGAALGAVAVLLLQQCSGGWVWWRQARQCQRGGRAVTSKWSARQRPGHPHSNLLDELLAQPAFRPLATEVSQHPLLICVGHGRTGTSSLQRALEILGLRAAHYGRLTMDLVRLGEGCGERVRLDPAPYEQVDAVVDSPVPSFYLELLARFPRARVILTVRDPAAWLESHVRHFAQFQKAQQAARLPATPFQLNADTRTYFHVGMDVSPNRMHDFGTNCPSPGQALKRYLAHNAQVRAVVPPDRLLELDIAGGDGWDKLCAFLGDRPVPTEPFPHRNIAN